MKEKRTDNVNKTLKQIGEVCRSARKRERLTIDDIARASDMSVSNISKFENGILASEVLLLLYLRLMSQDEIYHVLEVAINVII